MNFFQTTHPKNMKQIVTNTPMTVLLKHVFIKYFGDVAAFISIFLLEYEMKNCVLGGIVIPLPKYTLFKRVCLRPILNKKSRPCVFSLNFRFVFINTVIRRDILGK